MAWTEYTDCPACDKAVAVYNPRHGDGTIRITRWHKDAGGVWCRTEVDYGLPDGPDLRDTRYPATTDSSTALEG